MSEQREIVIWHEMDGQGDKSLLMIEQICKEVEEKYDIRFRFVCMNISEFIKRLQHLELETDKPDVIFIPQDMVSLEQAQLSKVPKVYGKNMDPAIWNSMKYNGVQRGVPYLQGNHAVLYYNKKYIKQPPKTFEEIANLNLKDVKKFAMDLEVAYWLLPFLYTLNGNPIKQGKFQVSEEATLKMTSFLKDLVKDKTLYHCEAISSMLDEFIQGNVACMINGEWLYEYLHGVMGEDIGICPLPSLEQKKMIGVTSSVGMAFPANSLKNKGEALDVFIHYMLSEEVQKRWLTEYRRFPVNMHILKQMESLQGDPNMTESFKQMSENVFLTNEACLSVLWSFCDEILEEVRKGLCYED